jgi:predicted dehydrogenase
MNVIIAGLGSIAKKHIAFLRHLDSSFHFFSLASNSRPELEGVTHVKNIDELHNISIDFIIVSNPTSLHTKSIIELSKLRKPFFVEKPLSFSFEDAQQLVHFLQSESLSIYVGYPLRFHPLVLEMKKLVDQLDTIEEVNLYNGSYLPSWRPGSDFKSSYSASKALGGGVELDMSHEIDLLYWFFGKPLEIRSFHSHVSSLNLETNDYANYLFSYAHFNASVILNYYRKHPKRIFEIVSASDVIEVDFLRSTLKINDQIILQESNAIEYMYLDQWSFYLESLRSRNVSSSSLTDILAVMKMIDS